MNVVFAPLSGIPQHPKVQGTIEIPPVPVPDTHGNVLRGSVVIASEGAALTAEYTVTSVLEGGRSVKHDVRVTSRHWPEGASSEQKHFPSQEIALLSAPKFALAALFSTTIAEQDRGQCCAKTETPQGSPC